METRNDRMQQFQKKRNTLFIGWLLIVAVVLYVLCEYPYRVFGLSQQKVIGLFLCAMACVLCIIMWLTGCIHWTGMISKKDAEAAGLEHCRRIARGQLLLFLGCTVLFGIYCFSKLSLPYSESITDSMAAAVCLGIPVFLTEKQKQ